MGSKNIELTETELRMVVARGWVVGEMGDGQRVQTSRQKMNKLPPKDE